MDPSELLTELRPLAGGYSGETYLSRVGADEVVVRIYAGRPGRRDAEGRFSARPAEVEAALLTLVRGLLPVPRVLEVRRPDNRVPGAELPAMLICERLPGVCGEEYYRDADAGARAALGERLGGLLADLAGMPLLRAGFFIDGELTVQPFGPEAEDLWLWAEAHLLSQPAGASDHSGAESWLSARAALQRLCAQAQARLDLLTRVCLVHGDFNLKNLLIDPASGQITGLLDWEFAHAGNPATDLGNLLRQATEPADAGYAAAVLAAYAARRGGSVEELRLLAEAADLYALIELAARAAAEPANLPARSARELLLRRLDQIESTGLS